MDSERVHALRRAIAVLAAANETRLFPIIEDLERELAQLDPSPRRAAVLIEHEALMRAAKRAGIEPER
jgi:hypothetical protein